MRTLVPALAAAVLLTGCSSTPPPPDATAPIQWERVAAEEVPQVVTRDPDGDIRVTKLWLVVVDGSGFVRTKGTRWLANIERDPDVVLRIGGAAYPLRAERVTDAVLGERVHQAFLAKYGFSARFNDWLMREPTMLRLVERTGP